MTEKTMRAARFHGKQDIRIERIPLPTSSASLAPNTVLIAPSYVGICGTDLGEYYGGPTFCPVAPHPVTGEEIPVVLGHEFSGVVEGVGSGVEGVRVGDRVAVQPTISCGECGACKAGVENACDKGGFIGLSGGGGGLSEHVVVPGAAVFALPEHISLDVGALVEPLAVAWHAVSASPLKEGDKVLVLGGGPIGLAVLQVLKARKAGLLMCAEIAPARQKFASQFGATHVLDPSKEDVVARSRELCGGEAGPDIVFDCAGVAATLKTACTAIKSRGTVVNVAIWHGAVPFDPNMLVFKEGKYLAVLGYQKVDFEAVLSALERGEIKPESMITKKIRLDDLVEEGVKTLIHDKDNHVKILVDMSAQ